MHITILTMGSRGDVQPFIALAVGLQQAGHTVRLVTHENFKSDIQRHGIEFALMGGNPQAALESEAGQALMQSKNPIEFARRMAEAFEPILEAAMQDAWKACQGTDVIIGASVAFWGFDIAQKLGVPFYMATLQPFPPTTSLPNAVMPPQLERLGGFYKAYRAAKLGVSPPMISRKNLTVDVLVEAINRAVHDQTIRDRAAALGEKIRSENGVAQAVEIVQQTMDERL